MPSKKMVQSENLLKQKRYFKIFKICCCDLHYKKVLSEVHWRGWLVNWKQTFFSGLITFTSFHWDLNPVCCSGTEQTSLSCYPQTGVEELHAVEVPEVRVASLIIQIWKVVETRQCKQTLLDFIQLQEHVGASAIMAMFTVWLSLTRLTRFGADFGSDISKVAIFIDSVSW